MIARNLWVIFENIRLKLSYRMSTIMCTLKEDHCLSSMGESHFLFMLICLDT